MTSSRKVLADHKRQGKLLVPPLVHQLGNLQEVSWVNTMIPELCGIGLIHRRHGHQRAVQLVTALARCAREETQAEPAHVFATASSFASLSIEQGKRLRDSLAKTGELFELQTALEPLISNYPECPLRIVFAAPPSTATSVRPVRDLVALLYQRQERDPMFVQATAIWLAFDAGVLKVNKGLALASFPEIERYPDTDLSKRVGANIRAALNGFFGQAVPFGPASAWPQSFWNRGLAIEDCEFANG